MRDCVREKTSFSHRLCLAGLVFFGVSVSAFADQSEANLTTGYMHLTVDHSFAVGDTTEPQLQAQFSGARLAFDQNKKVITIDGFTHLSDGDSDLQLQLHLPADNTSPELQLKGHLSSLLNKDDSPELECSSAPSGVNANLKTETRVHLHEVLLTGDEVNTFAVSFTLHCTNEGVKEVSGKVVIDTQPELLTLKLPSRDIPSIEAPPKQVVGEKTIERSTLHSPHDGQAFKGEYQPGGSLWVTVGKLIELVLPRPIPSNSDSDIDKYSNNDQPVYRFAQSSTVAASLVTNIDNSQTLLWVPTARDIGSNTFVLELDGLDAGDQNNAISDNHVINIEVLQVSNDTSDQDQPSIAISPEFTAGEVRVLQVGEPLSISIDARPSALQPVSMPVSSGRSYDQSAETAPYLKILNMPEGATFRSTGEASGVINWTPTRADLGFTSISLIAVDADDHRHFATEALNIHVSESSGSRLIAGWSETGLPIDENQVVAPVEPTKFNPSSINPNAAINLSEVIAR